MWINGLLFDGHITMHPGQSNKQNRNSIISLMCLIIDIWSLELEYRRVTALSRLKSKKGAKPSSSWVYDSYCYLVTKSCQLFSNPVDCNPICSSVHGISQARILYWVAISFSKLSSRSRNWTWVSCVGGRVLYHWATRNT